MLTNSAYTLFPPSCYWDMQVAVVVVMLSLGACDVGVGLAAARPSPVGLSG